MDCLGGERGSWKQQHIVVDLCVKTHLLLQSIDSWLMHQKPLNARKKTLIPSSKNVNSGRTLCQIHDHAGIGKEGEAFVSSKGTQTKGGEEHGQEGLLAGGFTGFLHQYGKKSRCDQCAGPDEIDVNPGPSQQPNAELFVYDPRNNCGHTEIPGAMDQRGEQSGKGS
jgi:hypothetical protein